MEQEIWKDIPGYEGIYQVSNLGNIKRLKSGKEKILKITMGDNYYVVGLLQKIYYVHRLVAITFIPNPENKPRVNHIDGNKLNNNISNLEWCTISENALHSHRVLLNKGPNTGNVGNKNILSKKVNQYTLNFKFIKQWDCTMDIKRCLGINNSNISSCCRGNRKQAGGFIWRYK